MKSPLHIARLHLPGILFALAGMTMLIGCTQEADQEPVDRSSSVWSIDLIRLLPGGEADYLRNIEGNWAQARKIAQADGHILSFQALQARPDSSLGWDILLMTEYSDSASWADREEIFSRIFDSSNYERVAIDRPSSELREFVNGAVVLDPIASSPLLSVQGDTQ